MRTGELHVCLINQNEQIKATISTVYRNAAMKTHRQQSFFQSLFSHFFSLIRADKRKYSDFMDKTVQNRLNTPQEDIGSNMKE